MEAEPPAPPATPTSGADNEKLLAVITHLMPLAGYILPALGTILGPLIWWAVLKDQSEAVSKHGTEVMNLAISFTLYSFLCIPLIFLLIGIPLIIAIQLGLIVCVIIGAIKAAEGEVLRYPLIIRFLRDTE